MAISDIKIKLTDIPLGSWDLHGNWYPSLGLIIDGTMSESKQRRHNMIGGHYNKLKPDAYRAVFVAMPEDPTLFERVINFFK